MQKNTKNYFIYSVIKNNIKNIPIIYTHTCLDPYKKNMPSIHFNVENCKKYIK